MQKIERKQEEKREKDSKDRKRKEEEDNKDRKREEDGSCFYDEKIFLKNFKKPLDKNSLNDYNVFRQSE